jgi:hypothetical protein
MEQQVTHLIYCCRCCCCCCPQEALTSRFSEAAINTEICACICVCICACMRRWRNKTGRNMFSPTQIHQSACRQNGQILIYLCLFVALLSQLLSLSSAQLRSAPLSSAQLSSAQLQLQLQLQLQPSPAQLSSAHTWKQTYWVILWYTWSWPHETHGVWTHLSQGCFRVPMWLLSIPCSLPQKLMVGTKQLTWSGPKNNKVHMVLTYWVPPHAYHDPHLVTLI